MPRKEEIAPPISTAAEASAAVTPPPDVVAASVVSDPTPVIDVSTIAPAQPATVDPPVPPLEFVDTRAELQRLLTRVSSRNWEARQDAAEIRALLFNDPLCVD